MAQRVRLLLVDGLNLIRRVYAAQPGPDGPERAESGRLSVAQSLERALRESGPSHAVVVFEGSGPTWRHELFTSYKQGHAPMPEALRDALPEIRRTFAGLGVASFELPGHEADDVIGTLATKTAASGGAALILSTDKIFLQLLGPRIAVRDHFAQRDLDASYVRGRFGVGPDRLLDLLALTGDSTNGIPGVRGIGGKTAAKLLASHLSLEALLSAAQTQPDSEDPAGGERLTPRLADLLASNADDARLARTLLALRTELELGVNLRSWRLAKR